MMNYDGLLASLKLDEDLEQRSSSTNANLTVENNEQLAASSQNDATAKREVQRKISSTNRFVNAFQQFYAGATNSFACNENVQPTEPVNVSPTNRTQNCAPKGMESKLLSMWHNVKYGWSGRLRSNFSKEQPVWLLGRCYHAKCTPPSSMETSTDLGCVSNTNIDDKALDIVSDHFGTAETLTPNKSTLYSHLYAQLDEITIPQELALDAAENQFNDNPWEEGIEGFRRDFYSRVWMTYRREFPLMNGTNYTSDCGWGCMLRSAQMLFANGLIFHFLGRSWRYDPDTQIHTTYEDNIHKKIIKWFGDCSSKGSPFSIHTLVTLGKEMGKKPGDWYGPASVSYLLRQALKNASQENADFDNITIYVAKDCTIYIKDIEDECCVQKQKLKPIVPWQTQKTDNVSEQTYWKSVIILIPLRLGTDKLNIAYAHCLKLLLSTENCIGIIGGRPKHSLYFVGFQEDKLIHLDPHYCQEMVDVNQENFSLNSFHCKSPRKLKASKMDPSCCIGFYCQNKADFEHFVNSVQLYLQPMRCASGAVERITNAQNAESNACQADQSSLNDMKYPLFTISDSHCLDDLKNAELSDSYFKPIQKEDLEKQTHDAYTAFDDEDDETEEFILL